MEPLIQTVKSRLSCIKLDNRNNTFTIKEAIKLIVYQLSVCKQKTTKVTHFQAHFGRYPNTPLIVLVQYQSLQIYHMKTFSPLFRRRHSSRGGLDDNGSVTGDRSDIPIEEAMQKAQVDAGRTHNGDKNKSISRIIMHPKLNNPIPQSE